MNKQVVRVFTGLDAPLTPIGIFELLQLLNQPSANGFICHKHDKASMHSTTYYDKVERRLYRARHDFGVLVILKSLTRSNRKLLIVNSTDTLEALAVASNA
jgi:hypothetical protein